MKTRRGYTPLDSIWPLTGLDTLTPSTQLNAGMSPNCENVIIDKGILTKRRGYQVLGAAFADPIVALIEFEAVTGTKHLVAITTKKQYRYDASSDAWINITYQVAAVDDDWTGTESDSIDYTVASGLDGSAVFKKWLIVTNGVDQPRYWDGVSATMELYAPDYPDFVTCKTLTLFYDRVMLGNVTTTSQEKTLIAWSVAGKLLDFTSDGSGAAIITNSRGEIVKFMALGDRLIIYSENSISSVIYVAGIITFSFEQIVDESRLVSPRAIVNIGPYHLYMAQETIKLFDGSRLTREIGDPIHRKYREELFVKRKDRAWAFHDSAKHHVYFNVPINETQSRVYQLDYNTFDLSRSTWVPQKFTDRPIAMGVFSRESNISWNSPSIAGLTWIGASFTWDQASVREGFPTRVMGTETRVFLADDTTQTDAGSTIVSFWDSKDFTVPESFQSQLGRWIELEIELKGVEVDVYISLDEGNTYTLAESLILESGWTKHTVMIDQMSETLRVRLVNNCANSTFSYRWLRPWVQPGGAA